MEPLELGLHDGLRFFVLLCSYVTLAFAHIELTALPKTPLKRS